MMLIGHIAKQEEPFWSADIDAIGAHTQGLSRKDAAISLAALVELIVETEGFKVTVSDIGRDGPGFSVLVSANDPALLAARVLRYQRERHNLTLADVAKKLGAASINAYAAYEQGKREPSLSKYIELLNAVAPEMALTVRSSARVATNVASVGVYNVGKRRVSRAAERSPAGLRASKRAREL